MCTNVPLGTSVAATKEMCLYILVSATPRRGAPPPLTPSSEGEAGAHQAGQQMEVSSCNPGEAPCPRRVGCPPPLPGTCQAQQSRRWAQTLWYVRGDPGPWSKQAGEGARGSPLGSPN